MNTLESQEHELFASSRELANKAQQERGNSKKSFVIGGIALAAGALWLGGNYLAGDMTSAEEKRAVTLASIAGVLGAGAIAIGASEVRMARRLETESNAQLVEAEALQFGRTGVHIPDAEPEVERPVAQVTPPDTNTVG